MKNVFILAVFISFLLVVSVANASLTITASASSSTVTTGTSVTVTAQFQADSNGGSGSFSLSCTPSTGYTVSEGSQTVNLGASASDTKYYTFTPSVSGTYSDCKVTDGQTNSGTMAFSVVNPSTISVDGQINGVSSTSITKNGGESFTLTVYVGPASSATTSSYALSYSTSYLSITGNDPTSGTLTIPASGSTSRSWTATLLSSFTSGTSTITFQLGSNSNAYSATVTGSTTAGTTTTTTTTTGTATSTAAKTKVTTEKGKATITIPSIVLGKSADVSINKTEDMSVKSIEIFVKNSVNNIQIIITKLADRPASITQSVTGKVYHYIQIDKTNITDADVNKTKIQFKVEKNWTSANNINESTIALNRYADNVWNKLTTTKLTDDTDYFYYEAESPGLSVFAITGEEKVAAVPTTTPTPTTEEKPTPIVSVSKAVKKVPIWLYIIFILAIVSATLFFFKYRKKIRAKV